MDNPAIVAESSETIFFRRLQDNSSSTPVTTDSSILRDTLKVYGSMFLVLFSVFCCARVRYPRAFNVRSWADGLHNKLADTHYGFIDWAWKLWWISDDDFREACGMDALCFIRVLRFGLKISLLGMFNSLWLCPMYATAPTPHKLDFVARLTSANVSPKSPRFFGTVISAYMVFGYVMHLMLHEFQWFTEQRHKHLARTAPQNFTVYVSHIPPEIRSSAKLLDYFRRAFSHAAVLEAHIALKIPNLEKKIVARDALVAKLEHAINLEEVKGVTPTHGNIVIPGKKLNSIDTWTKELRKENQEIRDAINVIEAIHDPLSFQKDLEDGGGSVVFRPLAGGHSLLSTQSSLSGNAVSADYTRLNANDNPTGRGSNSKLKSLVTSVNPLNLLAGKDDGEPREAGFVTFTKLSSTQACLQMIHHSLPFTMDVAEAPDPNDIFWLNIGRSHGSLQLGKLAGMVCTVMLCLFWTIPITFISNLSNIDELTKTLPFLADWVVAAPWLVPVLAQLAPVMIILLNAMLPVILGAFCKLEGPISSSVLEASLFVKLASFMIIQTFFVSALSGALVSEIAKLLDDPTSIVSVLAKSLPSQSTFFVQILLVKTFLGLGLELLRVTPLAIAGIRRQVGPRLTEKERNSAWFGLNPLAVPNEFEYAAVTSEAILYYMVLFVYSSTAPLASWFMFICFTILSCGYRYQFIYNGGLIWTGFIMIALPCMFIAQITLIGLLTLNEAALPAVLLTPLLVIHILFSIYIKQKHFLVTKNLPSRECLKMDLQNSSEGTMDFSFVKRKYVQPAMQSKEDMQPENLSIAREIAQEDVVFMTPPASEAELLNDEYEDHAFGTNLEVFSQEAKISLISKSPPVAN